MPVDQVEKFGIIAGDKIRDDLYRVTDMVEKPKAEDAPTNLAIIGRYILTPDIFDIVRDARRKEWRGSNHRCVVTPGKKGCVMAYKFKGKPDCGGIGGFIDR